MKQVKCFYSFLHLLELFWKCNILFKKSILCLLPNLDLEKKETTKTYPHGL